MSVRPVSGINADVNEGRVEITNHVPLKNLWPIYQSRVQKQSVPRLLNLEQVVAILLTFDHSFELTGKNIEAAIQLSKAVKAIFMQILGQSGNLLEMKDGRFDEQFDNLETHRVNLFVQLIKQQLNTLSAEALASAFNLVKKIKYTPEGKDVLIKIAKEYSSGNFKSFAKLVSVVNALNKGNWPDSKIDELNKKIVKKYIYENAIYKMMELISSIESEERQDRMYKKAIKEFVNKKMDQVKGLIFSIESEERQDRMYKKAIKEFVSKNALDQIKGLISSIESEERQDRMYKIAIKAFASKIAFDQIKGLISSIESEAAIPAGAEGYKPKSVGTAPFVYSTRSDLFLRNISSRKETTDSSSGSAESRPKVPAGIAKSEERKIRMYKLAMKEYYKIKIGFRELFSREQFIASHELTRQYDRDGQIFPQICAAVRKKFPEN